MDENSIAIDKGYKKANEYILKYFFQRCNDFGIHLLQEIEASRTFLDFTGNTITSISFGLYLNNKLTDIKFLSKGKPLMPKVKKGETVILDETYDGRTNIKVIGGIDLSTAYGEELSIKTLNALRPKGGNGIIVTTGTEYSEILERERGLNVITEAFQVAQNGSLRWFKVNENIPIEKQ